MEPKNIDDCVAVLFGVFLGYVVHSEKLSPACEFLSRSVQVIASASGTSAIPQQRINAPTGRKSPESSF
jgi:hypothetical protein